MLGTHVTLSLHRPPILFDGSVPTATASTTPSTLGCHEQRVVQRPTKKSTKSIAAYSNTPLWVVARASAGIARHAYKANKQAEHRW